MTEVRAVTPEMFADVRELLRDFHQPYMTEDDWRRMLFDYPWAVEEPHRGYALLSEGAVVGFIGTIFSAREVGSKTHRFCNLSSWIVKESHRSSSLELLTPIFGMRSHTIVNLSASPGAHEIFRRLGFKILEDRQVIVPAIPGLPEIGRSLGCRLVTDLEGIRRQLDGRGRAILDDMRGTLAAQLLLRRGDRACHVVACLSPWKRRLELAQVLYASDWPLFWDHVGLIGLGFMRLLGTAGLRVDGRRVTARVPVFALAKPLPLSMLYRPASGDITPEMIDGLYTEQVGIRWRPHAKGGAKPR